MDSDQGKRLVRGFAAASLAAGAVSIGYAPPAGAWATHGCRYDPASISPISYRYFAVTQPYRTAFGTAQSDWDATTAPGWFDEQSTSLDPEVNVVDDHLSATWWAQASWSCTGGGLYGGNEVQIQFNERTMAGLSAFERHVVAEHEIGHAYGLDHVDNCAVMKQGDAKFTCGAMPAADDVNGVHHVY